MHRASVPYWIFSFFPWIQACAWRADSKNDSALCRWFRRMADIRPLTKHHPPPPGLIAEQFSARWYGVRQLLRGQTFRRANCQCKNCAS